MARRKFSIFIIFFDTYTCSDVVYLVSADFDQNWIFYEFLKVTQKSGPRPCTIVQGISSKMARREFSIFIIFSDTYTCSDVLYLV